MAAFEYQAITAEQQLKKGVIQADSARQARGQLRQQGLIPLDVQAIQKHPSKRRQWVSAKERAIVFRQLATLLKAGMTLEEVLTVLTEQTERRAIRRAMGAVRARVMEGHSLSQAMQEFPALFPRLYIASVAAGERSGQLEAVLGRLADYASQREAMGRGLGLALIYPMLLLVIALAVVWALIGFVVPRIIAVFETASAALPVLTRSLLALSDVMSRFGGLALVLMIIAGGLAGWLYRREWIRLKVDRFMLSLPVVGGLLRAHQTALLTRTLSIMAASAVPLVDALSVSGQVLGNLSAQGDIKAVHQRVSEGVSLSKALAPLPWVSNVAKRLILAGERSGELSSMLEQAADIEERGLESAQSVVLSILQPAMILVVGLIVLYIVLAIMLPILNMSQLLGG